MWPDRDEASPLQDLLAAKALVEANPFFEPDPMWSFPVVIVPPVDYDPINPTPIMLMNISPEPPKPVCATLGCPHQYACINEGFCDDDYMLYHERPHIWQGDYA